ncbi:hypothetical protein B7P43_G10166, partial [Cryptotermes secundus]
MDILPGPSGQSFLGEPSGSLDSGQGGGGGGDGDDPEMTFLNALSLPYHYPRQCPYCPRILSHSGNWKKHVATIHGNQERNIPCWMCE